MKTRLLSELHPDERGVIVRVGGSGEIRRRLMDMGVVLGAEIGMERVAPLGDPVQIRVKDYDLALRKSEAEKIQVEINEGTLSDAENGELVTVVVVRAGWGLERRLKDMGLLPGTLIKVVNAGQPGQVLIEVRGSKLALGYGVAAKIFVRSGGDTNA